ncbi:MAG: hypothetical protein KatS3mg102_1886 [Planctomycetota bacterium]|nr:MAG: hypothetical protein KatS3mg102_1886 [Planctomycetota bacterium]
MTFLNLALLWLAGLAAVPVLIYLFHRHRYRVMPWAAMEFLRRAVQRNRRRLRLENLLLLAVRVLLILLVALAVARPVSEQAARLFAGEQRRRHVLLALDTSYSMTHRHGVRSAWERAVGAARGFIDAGLDQGDRLAIALLGAHAQFLYEEPVFADAQGRERVVRELEELEPSATAGDLAGGLAALVEYLPRFQGAAAAPGGVIPEVLVFTDLQRTALVREGALADPAAVAAARRLAELGVPLVFVDCGAERPDNFAVVGLRLDDVVAAVDAPLRLLATVRSWAEEPSSGLVLELFIDDVLNRSVPVELEPGEEREIEFSIQVHEPGVHHARVLLRSDGLEVDNARLLVFEAREGIQALVVDGALDRGAAPAESETRFFLMAIAPFADGRLARQNVVRPHVIGEAELAEADLDRYDVVVLADVIALPGEVPARLESWVRRGGGLLVALGDQVEPGVYNERLWRDGEGLLPARVGEVVLAPGEETFFKLRAESFRHPLLAPFAPREMRQLFYEPVFVGYRRVEPPADAGQRAEVEVLCRFEGRRLASGGAAEESLGGLGDPALLERRLGRGRVLLFTSALDASWSDFFKHIAYYGIWDRAVTYLAAAAAPARNLGVGEPFELVLPATAYAPEIVLVTPAGDRIDKTLERLQSEGAGDRFRLVHAETGVPGLYTLRFRRRAREGAAVEERTEHFAVNVEAGEESDLRRIDVGELERLLPGVRLEVRGERAVAGTPASAEAAGGGRSGELWRPLLLAALGLLALESWLACRFGRRAVA